MEDVGRRKHHRAGCASHEGPYSCTCSELASREALDRELDRIAARIVKDLHALIEEARR